MEYLNTILKKVEYQVTGFWFVTLLIGTGLYFTIYLKFPQIRYFKQAILIVLGKTDTNKQEGETSPLQALSTALSGSIGVGSIAGVALAIHLGGPSSLFWMLVTAFLGMATKLVETTLSHKYREKAANGTITGGPMYFMKNKLKMKWLGVIFSIATLLSAFAAGNLPQANSIARSIYFSWGIDEVLTGLVIGLLIAFVIIGGIKRVGKVAEKLTPLMSIFYFIGALIVIIYHYDNLIPSFISIFSDIFKGTAATGGFLGASVALALNQGVNRSLYSNDAGAASSAIAHASSEMENSVMEGILSILEPFISTFIVCMLTGMAILTSDAWRMKVDNKFDYADIEIVVGNYDEKNQEDAQKLANYLNKGTDITAFNGELIVQAGDIQNEEITFLNARSIGEAIKVFYEDQPFTGTITINNGHVDSNSDVAFIGKSLLNSADLASYAFNFDLVKGLGSFVINISLLLFGFTTVIAWYYYGDRSLVYLGGAKYLLLYKIIFVIAYFIGSITDATIVWNFSNASYALMAIPNLVGILLLRKDMKYAIKNSLGEK
ncbi:MAG: amino acid carrier protein [Cytophagales bacterium]|nr:amino acid carrier protein [Cytophagales bacterium]